MQLNFTKNENGLVPAIIQDQMTDKVLMLGFMNEEAYKKTLNTNRVTFYSRTKKRLWTKGEESGNYLTVCSVLSDCDSDTLLIKVVPEGPVCHLGTDTCWKEDNKTTYGFLTQLEAIIEQRKNEGAGTTSYVAALFEKGINKIAQKVGEEAVETVIEAKDSNDELFKNESADLLFHYLILLKAKGFDLDTIVQVLKNRHK